MPRENQQGSLWASIGSPGSRLRRWRAVPSARLPIGAPRPAAHDRPRFRRARADGSVEPPTQRSSSQTVRPRRRRAQSSSRTDVFRSIMTFSAVVHETRWETCRRAVPSPKSSAWTTCVEPIDFVSAGLVIAFETRLSGLSSPVGDDATQAVRAGSPEAPAERAKRCRPAESPSH